MHPGPFALPWFTSGEYLATVAQMVDRSRFPGDYDLWLMAARQVERELTRSGIVTCRVIIDGEAFLPWCRERGLPPGSEARTTYANEMAGVPLLAREAQAIREADGAAEPGMSLRL